MAETSNAVAAARALFETELANIGQTATWKQRTANTPTGTGRISQTAGRRDPVETGYVAPEADTNLYPAGTSILIYMKAPAKLETNPIATLQGMGSAKCKLGDLVSANDELVIDGVNWRVESVTVTHYCRELTIMRV